MSATGRLYERYNFPNHLVFVLVVHTGLSTKVMKAKSLKLVLRAFLDKASSVNELSTVEGFQ